MEQHQRVPADQPRELLRRLDLGAPEGLLMERTAGLQVVLKACLQAEATAAQQGGLQGDLQTELATDRQTAVTVVLQTARHQRVLMGKLGA
jgi:hypothetical protein